ncbi:uncharacterized protein BO97DRAFT_425701 [Aspergillus homomorphus CBS 101889]|uniref:Uncharacterized protein n=1 Tax=Aspergillus homomorphus (strain CBS 101889) TaxID=1450537 RepID=A0A395HX04_ASPHC|nr:hypothetical protein BO97DRAFT_425701 [Aspergillus homomorphus CBS 101889]RAL11388.1 hypothetical protein BO97DRAFT_425701 [Aspergillus homomorphus CBS 101889]
MSSENKQTQKASNGVSNSLSAGNLRHIPDGSSGSLVERFTQSPAADGPYFAGARIHDRSEHASRLSSQLEATEKVLKK